MCWQPGLRPGARWGSSRRSPRQNRIIEDRAHERAVFARTDCVLTGPKPTCLRVLVSFGKNRYLQVGIPAKTRWYAPASRKAGSVAAAAAAATTASGQRCRPRPCSEPRGKRYVTTHQSTARRNSAVTNNRTRRPCRSTNAARSHAVCNKTTIGVCG